MVDLTKYIEGDTLTGDVIAMLPADKRAGVVLPFNHGWYSTTTRNGLAIQKPVIPVELNSDKYELRMTQRLARLLCRSLGSKDTEKWVGQTICFDIEKKVMFGKETNLLMVKHQ